MTINRFYECFNGSPVGHWNSAGTGQDMPAHFKNHMLEFETRHNILVNITGSCLSMIGSMAIVQGLQWNQQISGLKNQLNQI